MTKGEAVITGRHGGRVRPDTIGRIIRAAAGLGAIGVVA